MPPHYNTAMRMLGVVENRILGPADRLSATRRRWPRAWATRSTGPRSPCSKRRKAKPAGTVYPDPYFGGEGPERTTCIGCGGCMMGCRYNAKNTLDKNYLYLAEKHGARVFAETRVVDVKPLGVRPMAAKATRCTP